MNEALAVIPHDQAQALMPAFSHELAVERHKSLIKFVGALMKDGTDFGKIPGSEKPTLLKPGAEKLTTFFGLSKRFHLAEKIEDWSGAEHAGEPFFYYSYRCALYNGETLIAESDGSCNSFESKYRWRKSERTCPACGAAAIIKGRAEYGGGWVCFGKKGGCGAKFPDGSHEIESQQVGRVPNPDVCDLVNTIQKMAQKRSFIAATLLAVNASEFFTQDVEDLIHEEPNGDARPAPPEPRRPASNGQARPAANQSSPAPAAPSAPASPEEKALDQALMEHCVKEKGDKNAAAFFKARYGGKTIEQKRALAREAGLMVRWAPALDESPVVDAEIVEDNLVEPQPEPMSARVDIENLSLTLMQVGCSPDHINNKIAKIAGGVYAIDEIAEDDLPKVRRMLNNYVLMGESAPAEMAREFAPKKEAKK